MTLLVLATRELHMEALRVANAVGEGQALSTSGLNAPGLEDAKLWVARLWDTAVGAIEAAWENGRVAAGPLIERFAQEVEELRASLAAEAAMVLKQVAEQMAAYVRILTRNLLGQFEEALQVGERRFEIQVVKVAQKVKVTGSLKASLTEVCGFVSEGEISVDASYEVAEVRRVSSIP